MVYGTSSKGKPPTISLIEGYKPVDALAAITTLAENAQLVLINEAHHILQRRAFTYLLLKALRRRGFTHFAAETLREQDKNLNERRYPIRTSGYYTREPLYGIWLHLRGDRMPYRLTANICGAAKRCLVRACVGRVRRCGPN